MADGALTITIPDEDAARIAERAALLGISPEMLALQMVHNLVNDGPATRQGDHVSNHDLNEEGRAWSDVRPELLARMKQKLAERT